MLPPAAPRHEPEASVTVASVTVAEPAATSVTSFLVGNGAGLCRYSLAGELLARARATYSFSDAIPTCSIPASRAADMTSIPDPYATLSSAFTAARSAASTSAQ
ncbi:hypothetical protein DB30_03498 [Enhygromyxa salina]|uniref:Uncharacterized protein n=1 Tax=Enhygromyxa salina TaxID=215803 RepID=A0A0C1ZLB5_9BACT|nr:hypothetical protein DB30_03498 [Enhygromyxa salina]